jgi:hypothetical protein
MSCQQPTLAGLGAGNELLRGSAVCHSLCGASWPLQMDPPKRVSAGKEKQSSDLRDK